MLTILQKNAPKSETQQKDHYNEGKPNSHLALDSKDERSIANKLAQESKRESQPEGEKSEEVKQSKIDATRPVSTTWLNLHLSKINIVTGHQPRQRAIKGRQDRPRAEGGRGRDPQEEGWLRPQGLVDDIANTASAAKRLAQGWVGGDFWSLHRHDRKREHVHVTRNQKAHFET